MTNRPNPTDRDDITALLGVSGLFLICVGLVCVALAFTPWAPLWEGLQKIARDIPGPAYVVGAGLVLMVWALQRSKEQ